MIVRMSPNAVLPPAHPLFEQPWPEGDFRFFQLGHVVDDVFAAADSWVRTFGIGPFHVLPIIDQRADYGGEIRTVRVQVAVAQAGPVQVELIQRPDSEPLGAGEAAHGPVTAAIANAVYDALELRIRNLPITRDSLIAAMESNP